MGGRIDHSQDTWMLQYVLHHWFEVAISGIYNLLQTQNHC